MSKDKSKPLFVSSFMQETPFHGFNLVANSTNKCEFLTWWLMIFGCICMTAYQTYCLAEYYRSEPTMSLITVRQGHNVTTSNPHVCFTWSFKPDGLGVYGRHIDKILSKVTNEQLHQLKLGNISSEIFPLPIWHLVMEILAEISSQELNVFYGRILQKQIFWGSTLKKQTASSTLNPILHKVSQFFAMRNVSIVQLAKATATVACQIMTVKVAMINYDVIKGKGGTSRPDVCRISAYSSLNRDGFCLFLDSPEHHLTFSNRNDRLQVNILVKLNQNTNN